MYELSPLLEPSSHSAGEEIPPTLFLTQKFLYLFHRCLLLDHLGLDGTKPQRFGIELQYYPSYKRYIFYCSGSFFMHISVTAHTAPRSLLLSGLYVLTIHLHGVY